ncbi:hypothetical protein [Streptomyces lydicus]|uniref:hypothetical protein n=1 Tax=Streptomyces lydicus TaxID=47763 RepID=UPI0036FA8A19
MAYESSMPYRAGTEGYPSFRIPAVVRTRSGTVLAVAEGRVSSAARAPLTLRAGRDGGLTRPTAQPVSGLPAACSALVRLDPETVGPLHETGDLSAYSTITFRRIPVEEPR